MSLLAFAKCLAGGWRRVPHLCEIAGLKVSACTGGMGGGGTGLPVGRFFDLCRLGAVPAKTWALGAWNGSALRASWGWGSNPDAEESVRFEKGHGDGTEGWDDIPRTWDSAEEYWRYRWESGGKWTELRAGRLFCFLQRGEKYDEAGKLIPWHGDHLEKNEDGTHVKAGGAMNNPHPADHGSRHGKDGAAKKAANRAVRTQQAKARGAASALAKKVQKEEAATAAAAAAAARRKPAKKHAKKTARKPARRTARKPARR